jgi:hypothetical protein
LIIVMFSVPSSFIKRFPDIICRLLKPMHMIFNNWYTCMFIPTLPMGRFNSFLCSVVWVQYSSNLLELLQP